MKQKKIKKTGPCFPLSEVKSLVKEGRFVIAAKARKTAREDFNWATDDVCKAILQLKNAHHYKRSVCYNKTNVQMDVYKAKIMGEDIYMHFYIDDDDNLLIIGSFKER